jgi:hypothetical protein
MSNGPGDPMLHGLDSLGRSQREQNFKNRIKISGRREEKDIIRVCENFAKRTTKKEGVVQKIEVKTGDDTFHLSVLQGRA